MRSFSIPLRLAVAFAGIAACSADGTGSNRGTAVASPNSPAAANPVGQPGASAGPNGFGNSNTTPVTSGPPVSMMQPPPATTLGNTDPISIDQCAPQNPAGLNDADAKKLMAGAGNANGARLLYPYDGTVFPRGLFAPLLMWDGSDAEFAYLHIKATRFEYKGCLKPTAPGQLAVPEDVWKAAGEKTMGSADPFSVELTLMNAGMVKGPLAEQIVIAQATLKGSIFYNSYTSMLPGGENTGQPGGFGGGGSGSVLRIPPGGSAERFTSTECNGCHSVSANGTRLLSSTALNGGVSYTLTPTTQPNPPAMQAGPRGGFGALYPDGSVYLATSAITDVARSSLAQAPGAPTDATLYQTDTGTVVANTGIPTGALMPIFSPDGSLLAFNDYAANAAHGLALMSFDIATKTASNYRVLYADSTLQPAWPFILPDNNGIVFARTASAEFSGEGVGINNGTTVGPSSELYIADIKTGAATILAQAMGYRTPADAAAGTTYLPFGSEELKMDYYPTVSPVAAGGYFWVLFDSMRHYGNQGLQRQLWGAAVSIAPDGTYNTDVSHPAFYLPGQELGTANHRAFAALEPCKQDGNDCTSGVDCCGGFCFVPDAKNLESNTEAKGTCTSTPPTCARTNERCASNDDCCPPEMGRPPNMCIAGFCAVLQATVK
jgi:hypothetical protein